MSIKGPISILIANYEGGDAIRLCIESIRARTAYPPGYSIMVYDSPGKGKDREFLRAYQAAGDIALIEGTRNLDHGAAIRMLMEKCDTDWAITLDSDCEIILPDWVSALIGKVKDENKTLVVARYRPVNSGIDRTIKKAFVITPTYWLACMLINVGLYKPIADIKDFPFAIIPVKDYPWVDQLKKLPGENWNGNVHVETGGWLAGRILSGEIRYGVEPMPEPFWPHRVIHYGGISRNASRPDHPWVAPRWNLIRDSLKALRSQCSL